MVCQSQTLTRGPATAPKSVPVFPIVLCFRFQRAVKVRSSRAAINEEISAGNKSAFIAHQQFGHIRHFISCAGPACRTFCEHIFVEIAAGTVELIQRQGSYNDAGRD